MSNVINIADHRKKVPDALRDWTFDLRIFSVPGGSEGLILDHAEAKGTKADQLRRLAGQLDELRFLVLQQAHQLEPDADGRIVATLSVFESSRVQLRSNSDMVVSELHADWLRERLDDAKDAVEVAS